MNKEEVIQKFNEAYSNSLSLDYIPDRDTFELFSQDKLGVSCKKCNHSWTASIQNLLVFRAGCYECC